MLPVALPGEQLRHDIGAHICRGNVIEGDQVAGYGPSNKVIPYIDVFCSIVELEVSGELYSSLVVSEDSLWLLPGGFDARRGCEAVCIEQRLPLLCSLVLVVCTEVRRRLPNLAGFQLRSKRRSHITSFTASDNAMYSASVVDRATMSCFLVFQDITPPQMVITYPPVERRSCLSQPSLSLYSRLALGRPE